MKRLSCILCLMILLSGCRSTDTSMTRAMEFRTKLLSHAVAFDSEITADYGEQTFTFQVSCDADAQGELTFTVKGPESISGISGKINSSGGKLTFDDQALAFALLADGQVSPVSAPWLLMNTLRCGYLTSSATERDNLRLSIDDSYADDALHLDVWLDSMNIPVRGEILWKGRRILSMDVTNFRFL